jgi:hypothetical protein
MGDPAPSERADDGIGASVCARSGAPALIPGPSAVQHPQEDAPRPDLIPVAAVMATVPVSNLLVQGVDVDVGGCSHLHLYHLGRLSSLRCCSSWCVTHD